MTSVKDEVVVPSSATHPHSQRERQRADTRERIFQAAVAEFLRSGYGEAQIPRIAAAAGVVRGTFYFHFPSKEHVLRELMERVETDLVERLRAQRGVARSLRDVLSTLVDAVTAVNEALEASRLVNDVLAMYVRAGEEAEPADRDRGVLDELSHHVALAVERGELRRDVEPERMAALVLTSVLGLNVSRRSQEGSGRADFDLLVELLLEGMGGKSA
jgi:AcrR family transcriptional regulator